MPFRPIEHDRAADPVGRRIEGLILDGVLRSGDRLPGERDLAQRLEVSRPVLREALKRLEERGLLVGRPGEGTFVAELIGPAFAPPLAELLSRDDRAGRDTLEFRRAFEGWTAELAARRVTADDRAMIERLTAAMRAAHAAADEVREAELDVALHMTIAEAAHNLVALHVAHAINRLQVDGVTTARPKLYLLPAARERLLAEHLAIAEAILAGDPIAARARAEAHVDGVAADLAELAAADARERASRDRLEVFDLHCDLRSDLRTGGGTRRRTAAAAPSRPTRNDESAA